MLPFKNGKFEKLSKFRAEEKSELQASFDYLEVENSHLIQVLLSDISVPIKYLRVYH